MKSWVPRFWCHQIWAELVFYIILLHGCPSPGHQNLPNASSHTTSLPPAQGHFLFIALKASRSFGFSSHAQQKLKTAPLSLPASLPPVPGQLGSTASCRGLHGHQVLVLLSSLPLDPTAPPVGAAHELRTPLPPAALSSAHSQAHAASESVLPGHSCRISNLPPNVLESMWVSSLNEFHHLC